MFMVALVITADRPNRPGLVCQSGGSILTYPYGPVAGAIKTETHC